MLRMENSTEAEVLHSSTTFSQVVFNDIPHSYPPSKTVTCNYTLTAAFKPNSRDWIGIFKVGWSTTKDYHTFVWVETTLDLMGKEPFRKEVVFQEYYLPRDDVEFYQFCYIDSTGQVRGASTPFCFKNMEVSADCSLENDCLVITTQEQAEQSTREKEELLKELRKMKEQEETTQRAQMAQLEEVEHLKQDNMQMARENEELVRDLNHFRGQNETMMNSIMELKQETNHLKENNQELVQKLSQLNLEPEKAREHKNLTQGTQSMEKSLKGQEQSLNPMLQKYEKAVIKINLLKREREQLKEKVDVQIVDIAQQSTLLRESEEEIQKLRDHFQLLEVDLRRNVKEKKRLSEELLCLSSELEERKRENTELRQTRSDQTPLQNIADEDLKAQFQTVVCQLNDSRAQVLKEVQVSKVSQQRAEHSEKELQEYKETLKKVKMELDLTKLKNGKLEIQLTDLQLVIEEKTKDLQKNIKIIEDKENMQDITEGEKEELSRQNLDLRRDIEKLRKELADLQLAPPADSFTMQHPNPYVASTHPTHSLEQQLDSSALYESPDHDNPYENLGSFSNPGEEVLECLHCKERFPGITQYELEIHEQSHRVCPFCTLICDTMEQALFEDHVYNHGV